MAVGEVPSGGSFRPKASHPARLTRPSPLGAENFIQFGVGLVRLADQARYLCRRGDCSGVRHLSSQNSAKYSQFHAVMTLRGTTKLLET